MEGIQMTVTPEMIAIQDLAKPVIRQAQKLDALSVRVNQLELAHNRLAHFCGCAAGGTPVGQDNWAETGGGAQNEKR